MKNKQHHNVGTVPKTNRKKNHKKNENRHSSTHIPDLPLSRFWHRHFNKKVSNTHLPERIIALFDTMCHISIDIIV